MSQKLIYLVSFVLVLSMVLTSVVKADLIGWWRLDEGTGTTVADVSGAEHHGLFAEGTPEWVEGKYGKALKFDGNNKVEIPDHPDFHPEDAVSIALWAKPEAGQLDWGKLFCRRASTGEYLYSLDYDNVQRIRASVTTSSGSFTATPRPPNFPGEWGHLCLTYDGSAAILYKDGEEVARIAASGKLQQDDVSLSIGGRLGSGQNFTGIIDDVYLYSHALSIDEIQTTMKGGGGYPYALGPEPADSAMIEDTWVNLSWSPGDFTVSHDVYIGDNFDDVDSGAEGTFQGNQTATFFIAGFPGFIYPDGLVPGTTYYWRIDEVNDTEPNSPWKGPVWSFSVPPKTAYNPVPADGAESVGSDADLSWKVGFGSKLHTIYFGDNFDDVNNAAGGIPQGATTYDPGALKLAETYYWRVDEFDGIATYEGNVWSFTTEGAVGSPDPSNGAADVEQTPVLTWTPGVYGASHEVYFGTDEDAVKNADTGSPEYKGSGNLGSQSYDPGKLELNATYYWRIDEANNVNPDSPWTGSLWSFTTVDSILVEDFEDYNDYPPDEIFSTWIDGYGTTTNGSTAGYAEPDWDAGENYVETTIVHGGGQSMPLFFDNNFKYSEATMTLTQRDWTAEGVEVLSLWFYGDASNAAERMYVALNGNAVVYHDNPNGAQIATWTQWTIDLQEFAAQGVNLANVNTISIGFGDKNNLQAGGSGMVFFDDIRLYRPAQ